jgi:Uma2 family endonuclease
MVELGVLREDDPLELIRGDLIVVSPQGPVHSSLLTDLAMRLQTVFGSTPHLRVQLPLDAGEDSQPGPDVAVVAGVPRDYLDHHPRGRDCVLAVEVAVTSQDLDHAKAPVYAAAGVPEYWLLDVPHRRLEVHRHPSAEGYGHVTILSANETVRLPASDVEWRVSYLLD